MLYQNYFHRGCSGVCIFCRNAWYQWWYLCKKIGTGRQKGLWVPWNGWGEVSCDAPHPGTMLLVPELPPRKFPRSWTCKSSKQYKGKIKFLNMQNTPAWAIVYIYIYICMYISEFVYWYKQHVLNKICLWSTEMAISLGELIYSACGLWLSCTQNVPRF